MFERRTLVPWIIAILMGVYVLWLENRSKARITPDPGYGFYDSTQVKLFIEPITEFVDVYGIYNNVVEGKRQIVQARTLADGSKTITFQINSPRPALLFINEEEVEVFLVPDSLLTMRLSLNTYSNRIETAYFEGFSAGISQYYRSKAQKFGDIHFRSIRNTMDIQEDNCLYSQILDSIARDEMAFLSEVQESYKLPEWFLKFEKSEINYHKAYLKLSAAYNINVPESCLDKISLNNEDAVFSYYYYLYVKTYITEYLRFKKRNLSNHSIEGVLQQIKVADTLLAGEVHDVVMTRYFLELKQMVTTEESLKILNDFKDNFSKMKYVRFVEYRLKNEE